MKVQIKHDKDGNILSFGISVVPERFSGGGPLRLVSTQPEAAVTEVDVPQISEELTERNQEYIADLLTKILKDSRVDLTSKRLVNNEKS